MLHRLDDIDRSILYSLSRDARRNSATDIVDHVQVSAQVVRNRIKQLGESSVIKQHHPQIDYERVDCLLTNLFMCATSTNDRKRLTRQPFQITGVVNIREIMTGHTNLQITATGHDTDGISQIAQAITDIGVDIEKEDLVRREHVSPYRKFDSDGAQQGSAITDFVSLAGDAELLEITIEEGADIAGKTLEEANANDLLDEDVLVITIERDNVTVTPCGKTTAKAGDAVTLLLRGDTDAEFRTTFGAGVEG